MQIDPRSIRVGVGKPIGVWDLATFPNKLTGPQVPPEVTVLQAEAAQQKDEQQQRGSP